jgi:CheY-like chemotaxis protein
MLYLGIVTDIDKNTGKAIILPVYVKDSLITWKKSIEQKHITLDLDNYTHLSRKNEIIRFSFYDNLHEIDRASIEIMDLKKFKYVFEIPMNYPPLHFIRSVKKLENIEFNIKEDFLLKDSDSIYSSFQIASEYTKIIKFESCSHHVFKLRLYDTDNEITLFNFPDIKGIPPCLILKEEWNKLETLLKEKGDLVYMYDPKEIIEKHQILENFSLENKSGFGFLINMYKMQTAEKKIQKELKEIEKKKSVIEEKIEETSIVKEKLQGEIEKLHEDKIKLQGEYEKELNNYEEKKEELKKQLENIEDNVTGKREVINKEIEEILNKNNRKKEEIFREITFLENNSIETREYIEELEKIKTQTKLELNEMQKNKEKLLRLEEELKEKEAKIQEDTKILESNSKILKIKENVIKNEMVKLEQVTREKTILDQEVRNLKENKDSLTSELENTKKELEPLSKELSEKRWKMEQIQGKLKELSIQEEQIKGDSIKILIVEDNKLTRKVTSSILIKHNFDVIEAENGNSGFNLALDRQPDLILMDLMLPDISGYEVTEKLKKSEKTAHIPIIAFSAMNETESIMRAMKSGCCDYLVKPFKIQEFLQKIFKFISSEKLEIIKQLQQSQGT